MTALPVIGVGASAGGVEAMRALFAELPRDIPAAVLVVMHMPSFAPSRLDSVLATTSRMPISAATQGERIRAGHVYVATPDRHLILDGDHLRLSRGPKECRMRPAVDVLFRSLAAARGPRAAGVVLSGMLDDGTAGLWALKENGGAAFVQDPEDALHPDMPRSALENVNVDVCAGAPQLAANLARWARGAAEIAEAPMPSEALQMEVRIADEANALQSGVMTLGPVSKFACPECHGVLVQIKEGKTVRFRCHTGHAYSQKTLLAEVSSAIDTGLWATLRATEERLLLLRQMAELARERGAFGEAEERAREAACLEKPINLMRELVTDENLFGHADATN